MGIINIIAILLSPLIAILVTIYLQRLKERRDQQHNIFSVLIATRHTPVLDQNVRALNSIDVVFYNRPRVRQLWHEYFDMLNNSGLNNLNGWAQRQKKNLEMLTEMAKVVGYREAITHLDVDRVYYPQGLGEAAARQNEIGGELLRILRSTDAFVLGRVPAPVAMNSNIQDGAEG